MRRKFFIAIIGVASLTGALLLPTAAEGAGSTSSAKPTTVKVHKVGSAHLEPGEGEIKPEAEEQAEPGKDPRAVKNGFVKKQQPPPGPSGVTPSQPSLAVSHSESGWQGVNHYDQRFTDGGNQFSTEPPDQALCVGNGQVFEGVNTAVRSYSASDHHPLSDVISLNKFFFNDHAYDRANDILSPHDLGDPSCVYDAGSNRFFLTVYDLAEDAAGNLLGPAFVDIAVSPVGTTLGTWSVYQLDVTNDGTDGTPSRPGCPCFADYPHIGTDANGFYISTNEYGVFSNADNGAVVYAIDKTALANGTAAIPGAVFDARRQDLLQGTYYNGRTLAPAVSAGTAYAGNTMYFLSSDAVTLDAGPNPGSSTRILLWKIANTSAIHSNPSSLRLSHVNVPVAKYSVAPFPDQKAGPVPQADCLNLTACSKALLGKSNPYHAVEGPLDVIDTPVLQSAYAHGHIWGALDTAVDIGGATKAGVAYYVVNPDGSLLKQGTIAVAGNHITYPAMGVTSAGRGVMAVTLTGHDYYPSAAYVKVDDVAGNAASGLTVVGAGVGPQDGFSEYRAWGPPYRPRWGDYGAASVVGGTVWIASEYIAQSCTLAEYQADFTCGKTRSALANWSTHIASVTP